MYFFFVFIYQIVVLGIRVFGSAPDKNHSVLGISDKSFLYPIGIYEISVRFRFVLNTRLIYEPNIYIYIYIQNILVNMLI